MADGEVRRGYAPPVRITGIDIGKRAFAGKTRRKRVVGRVEVGAGIELIVHRFRQFGGQPSAICGTGPQALVMIFTRVMW